jgi:hypothetical protein
MSITSKSDRNSPAPWGPEPGEVHPLVVLSLGLSLAAIAGMTGGWGEAVIVFTAVLELSRQVRGR